MTHPDTQLRGLLNQVAGNCVCFQVRRASRLITQQFDQAMAPLGLRGTQFTLLVAIYMMESARVKALSEALAIDRTTLTRTLKRLVKDGHIDMVPGQDRRERIVALTEKGESCLREALPIWQSVQTDIISHLEGNSASNLEKQISWPQIKRGLSSLLSLETQDQDAATHPSKETTGS